MLTSHYQDTMRQRRRAARITRRAKKRGVSVTEYMARVIMRALERDKRLLRSPKAHEKCYSASGMLAV